MLYFAYGSNMLVDRLRQPDRAPRAEPLETAVLHGHRLAFHKRGRDGSGKADAFVVGDPRHEVHGVLFRITASCQESLHRIEGVGRGYRAAVVELEVASGGRRRALTYLAEESHIEPDLVPYAWYRDLVLAGALEHRLPPRYVRAIEAVVATPDPSPERAEHERRVLPHDFDFPAARAEALNAARSEP